MNAEGLRATGLTVTYPGRPPRVAVQDASFHLDEGDSLALVGASGSGKSSLLLAIAGVLPFAGQLTWDGEDMGAVPAHRRGFGLVFQDGQLFPHLNVAQNIGFGLEMSGVGKAQQRSRIGELLDMVELRGAETRKVTELSGGERQRIALARTLAPKPRLVLLDEPLSSLDAKLRTRLAIELTELLTAAGATWIVVTHDEAEAKVMAAGAATMSNGRLSP